MAPTEGAVALPVERLRLHRAAVAIEAAGALRELAIPAAILFVLAVAGSGSAGDALVRGAFLAAAATVLSVVGGYVRWHTTRWWLDGDAIHLRRGLLQVRQTSVSFDRVQSVDTVRGPLHRWLGVVELHVGAAGGGRGPEVSLSALEPAAARSLRDSIDRRAPEVGPEREPSGPTRRLSRPMLVLAALTTPQLGIILPIAAAAGQTVQQLLGETGMVAGLPLPDAAPVEIALVLLAVVAAAWLVVTVGAAVVFWNHTVTREPDRLVIRRGLVARRRTTIPIARVQAAVVVEGLAREPLGFCQLRVETAGFAAEAAAASTLMPLLRTAEARSVLTDLLPELSDGLGGLDRPPARAARRYVLPPTVLALVTAGLLVPVSSAAALVAAAILGSGAMTLGLARYRAAGVVLRAGRLVIRERRIARRTAVIAARRLPLRGSSQNPLQRRSRLATLSVAVASGARFGVSHLDSARVDGLLARLSPVPATEAGTE